MLYSDLLADDFEKANQKLKVAEDTSDVMSDEDVPRKIRKVSKPARYQISSDSEEEINNCQLPILPKKNSSFLFNTGTILNIFLEIRVI